MDSVRSGLIVEIPEAEPAVAEPRHRLDRVAALGVPAHVTALFPFVRPDTIQPATLRRVCETAAAVAPFDYRFARTAWFAKEVLCLVPDRPEPFAELTGRLWATFPDCPPYGGQFDEVVPHLTIGQGADPRELLGAEAAVLSHGPVEGRARRLTLMTEGIDGHWSRLGFCVLGDNAGFQPI